MNNIEKTIDADGNEIQIQKRGWFDFILHSEIDFEGRKENEKVLVFTRRHWFILINPIVGGFFASLLPFIFIILGAGLLIKYNLSAVFTLIWLVYLMIIWFFIFYKLTMYALDTWIVTNERIVDTVQKALFTRKVSELHLSSIEDISVNTNGFIQSYFDYGNIEIQTAGTAQRFLFEETPKPLKIKDIIMNAIPHKSKPGHGFENITMI